MIKTILLILLGVFFILNGVNHLYNSRTYEKYARRRSLIAPRVMVRLSGVALIAGGISLMSGYFYLILIGSIGLCIFLVAASLMIHQFWKETENEMRMLEGMHFTKNMAILTELVYIATTTGA